MLNYRRVFFVGIVRTVYIINPGIPTNMAEGIARRMVRTIFHKTVTAASSMNEGNPA